MTTIAYKDGIVAFDSRITSGMTINYDDCDKSRKVNGTTFFLAGYTCDYQKLIDAWFGEPVKGSVDASAIVFDGAALWYASCSEQDGLCKSPLSLESPYVIGSGTPHAQTAMDMGCTAAQAVKMAMKRDAGTGGKVRTFKLPR